MYKKYVLKEKNEVLDIQYIPSNGGFDWWVLLNPLHIFERKHLRSFGIFQAGMIALLNVLPFSESMMNVGLPIFIATFNIYLASCGYKLKETMLEEDGYKIEKYTLTKFQ